MSPSDWLPPSAYAAALAGLPRMGPARLRLVLSSWPPEEAWARTATGRLRAGPGPAVALPSELCRSWQRAAAGVDPADVAARHADAGVTVTLLGERGYPEPLSTDIEPPVVLFHRGDLTALDAPRVAVVGTRRCTTAGAVVARELGADLAAAGVVVLSGLALGIDGAAHRGALDAAAAPPVGVVGNGLDSPYPARNRTLWFDVSRAGLLLGEAPAGAPPAAWRFPARNRILAALADVVVVVESHLRGGSMHTVEEAAARSTEVMAVPGSVRNPAADGTNRLLRDGCAPVLGADDVLVALGLTPGGRRRPQAPEPPDGDPGTVLAAFDGVPLTLEHLALRTKLPLDRLGLAVHCLVDTGWVAVSDGWYERTGPVTPEGAR